MTREQALEAINSVKIGNPLCRRLKIQATDTYQGVDMRVTYKSGKHNYGCRVVMTDQDLEHLDEQLIKYWIAGVIKAVHSRELEQVDLVVQALR